MNPSIRRGHRLLLTASSLLLAHRCFLVSLQADGQFRLFTRPLAIPERGNVTSYVLQTEHWRFCFLPPPNWAVKENRGTGEVVMMAPNLVTCIRFKIIEATLEETAQARATQWRKEILESYPDARIVNQFACYTSNLEGVAFDLERITQNKARISMRLAFVPLTNQIVQFNLTAASKSFHDCDFAFANLLSSFRAEPAARGKREKSRSTRSN